MNPVETTEEHITINRGGSNQLLMICVSALLAIGGIVFSLVLQRMDKQEEAAKDNIAALREEIKTTKADAKDAVNSAAAASKDAVSATASALRESVAATAEASKDAVQANAMSARDAVAATASSLSDKIELLRLRVEKLESRPPPTLTRDQ